MCDILARRVPAAALAGEVGLWGARALGPALRLLPVLLAPERGEVEEVVRAAGRLEPARVLRVGVEDAVLDAQERAPARHLVRLSGPVGLVGDVAVVVLARPLRRVDGHAEVVVEVAAVGRVPGEVFPALLRLPRLE